MLSVLFLVSLILPLLFLSVLVLPPTKCAGEGENKYIHTCTDETNIPIYIDMYRQDELGKNVCQCVDVIRNGEKRRHWHGEGMAFFTSDYLYILKLPFFLLLKCR